MHFAVHPGSVSAQEPAAYDPAITLLVDHLRRLGVPKEESGFEDLHSFLLSFAGALEAPTSDRLTGITRSAFRVHAIDRVEASNLLEILPAVVVHDGRIEVNAERIGNAPKQNRRSERILRPDLLGYERVKNHFIRLRKERLSQGEITRELEQRLFKAYPRAIFFSNQRISLKKRVGFQEYLLSRFERIQIERMAEILDDTIQMTLGHSKIVTEMPDGTTHTEELTPPEQYRLAMNRLDTMIEKEVRHGLLRGMSIDYGDLILAGVIAGRVEPGLLLEILRMKEFQEPRHEGLKRWGLISMSIVRTVGYLNPYTAPAVIMGSVVYESIRTRKEFERAASRKTQIIRR